MPVGVNLSDLGFGVLAVAMNSDRRWLAANVLATEGLLGCEDGRRHAAEERALAPLHRAECGLRMLDMLRTVCERPLDKPPRGTSLACCNREDLPKATKSRI